MAATITQDHWATIRTSLAQASNRFAELIASARDPLAMATVHWTVADTAAHTASVAWMYTTMLASDDSPFPIPALQDQVNATTVDTVADLNVEVMQHYYTERDLPVLADRLRADIGKVLQLTDGLDPAKPVSWLGSAQVPLAGVFAHLLNEILVHGRDIARALGTRWEISPKDTAMFFELFIMGMTRYDIGRLLDNDEPARERRIAVEFRSKYTTPVTMVLQHGRVSLEKPGGATDVHVSFDPTTLDLMMFGRVSQVSAVLTGKVVVWGRRPWLLPTFLRTVRLPN